MQNSAENMRRKDDFIYSKERDVGLKVVSYYGSKLALLGVLGLFAPVQAQQCELTDGVVSAPPALRRWLGEPARIFAATAPFWL